MMEDDIGAAEELCRCFHGVFVREAELQDSGEVKGTIGEGIVFDEDTVINKLRNLKPDKSPGPDGMQQVCGNIGRPIVNKFHEVI